MLASIHVFVEWGWHVRVREVCGRDNDFSCEMYTYAFAILF